MSWSRALACEKRSAPAARNPGDTVPAGLALTMIKGAVFARVRESRMIETPPRNSLESRLSSQLVVSLTRPVLVVLEIP